MVQHHVLREWSFVSDMHLSWHRAWDRSGSCLLRVTLNQLQAPLRIRGANTSVPISGWRLWLMLIGIGCVFYQ
jgi:hypothetical protein